MPSKTTKIGYLVIYDVMYLLLVLIGVFQQTVVRLYYILKKGVLKNFAKFIGKHLHWSFFLNKVPGLMPC